MTVGNASAGWRAESSGARVSDSGDIRPLGERAVDADLYRLLVHTVTDYGIFLLDPAGYVASWNDGAQRIKGYLAEEIIGRHFSTFYPQEDIASGKPAMELEVAGREGRFEDEGWRVRKDGSLFWANVVITALRNDARELVGFAKVTRDLTERRAAQERAIADSRRIAEIEVANRTKSEFLAAMSHELRTPLNAIGGYTELIELEIGGPVTEQQQGYLSRIRESQQHLRGIITDLLNYSRLEARQLTYNVQSVPVRAVVETVVPLVEPQAAARKVTLRCDPCVPEMVMRVDRMKVEQILLNLLSNAVKFTRAGGTIDVSCELAGDFVAIVVRDTGVGIPDDKLDAIFEPFVQLGRSLSSMREGTGLGLAISRELARAMDGDVTVESTVDSGSTFRVLLPRG
jgi:PAS domain S-box-containing protein